MKIIVVMTHLVRVTRPAIWTAARKSPAEIEVEISL